MFIIRNLIIIFMQQHHFYTQTERRGKGQAAGETERESERRRVAENGVGIRCKKWLLEERLTILGHSRDPDVRITFS
jgi:hypothetical protein